MMKRKVLGCLTAGLLALSGCGRATQRVPATAVPARPTDAPTAVAPTATPAPEAGTSVDLSDPASVVEAVFAAAQNEDYSQLAGLCDPLKQNDIDTQKICDLATDETDRGEFITAFAKGTVAGPATITSEGNDQIAEVPILFGPDGDHDETFKLIQRDGKWYLSGL